MAIDKKPTTQIIVKKERKNEIRQNPKRQDYYIRAMIKNKPIPHMYYV